MQKAKQTLDVLKLSEEERKAYEQYQEDLRYQASMFFSSFEDGRYEGRKEGRKEGQQAAMEQMAKTMKAAGEPAEKIVQYTGLSLEEIATL